MSDSSFSLLDDPLIRVRDTDDSLREMTLPQIYAALADDRVMSFSALQPHQQQPWYSFLAQSAAMALDRAGRDDFPDDESAWRQMLVDLADGSDTAWQLVTADPSQPAFMQPPIPEGSIEEAGYKADTPTPDMLDMLITSKTHDIKQRRISRPRPEHWLFALVTLQTLEGFLGRGNYGIVRMNGGFGNRPFVGLSPDLSWGARLRRDVRVLLDHRDQIAQRHDFNPEGHALLWLVPWDGAKDNGIPLSACHPYFIEICRRIRLTLDESGEMICWRMNTKAQRIDAADELNGRTGDPWTPVDKGGGKALTLGGDGFTYERLQEIWLSDDYQRPPTLEFQDGDPQTAYLVATSLIRGQGKTEGWHRRIIPVPEDVATLFSGSDSDREKLARRARDRVELASEVQSKVLRGPTFTLVYGGRSPAQPNWDKINKWISDFDRDVDDCFFDALWDSVRAGMSDDEAATQWQHILRELAEAQYQKIRESIPLPSIHRYRVLSNADGQFNNRLRSVLDRTFDQDDTTIREPSDERLSV